MSAPELHDIVGQDEAICTLQQVMHSSRLPHAFCFAGPEGVGRRTTAVALAKTLLCQAPVDRPGGRRASAGPDAALPFRHACGRCDDCRMMGADSHPDFHLVYKELARYHDDPAVRDRVMQDLGIDVIRSFLIAPAGRSATRGRGKVFVVLEADLMSTAAQNALLKTLEEPPRAVRIILICRRPQQLLPTTRSRCAMIRFGPLPAQFIIKRLTADGVEAKEAEFWAAFTGGSVGRAIRLAQRGLYKIKQDILERLAKLPPEGDIQLGEHLAKVADKLAGEEVSAVKRQAGADLSKMLASRRAAEIMLELIAGAFSDALMLATGADRRIVNADQTQAVKALAERFEPLLLAEIIRSLARLEEMLWRNVNPRIVWDNVAITCASAAPVCA